VSFDATVFGEKIRDETRPMSPRENLQFPRDIVESIETIAHGGGPEAFHHG
jgi:hypothetical protein